MPPEEIFGFYIKIIMFKCQYGPLFDFAVIPQLLSTGVI